MMPAPPQLPARLQADRAVANLIHPGVPHRYFRTPVALRRISRALCLLILLSLTAGYLVTVDKLVDATGYLETDARLFPVRSPLDGRIAAIKVREDDRVSAGQQLIALDDEEARLRVDQQKAELARIIQDHYRLSAQLRPLMPEAMAAHAAVPALPGTVAPESTRLYRRQILDTRRARELAIEDLENQLNAARHQQAVMSERATLAADQLRQTARLVASGARSASQRRSAKAEWLALRVERDRQNARIEQLQHAIETERAGLLAWQTSTGAEHRRELQQLTSNFHQARAELSRREKTLREHHVIAPVAGLVSAVNARGPGELIARGDTLLQLRPAFQHEHLYLEIRVPARDAVWIEPGMPFRAVAAGTPAEDHGVLHGTIDWLTAMNPEGEEASARVYRARGRVERVEAGVSRQDTSLDRPGLQLRVSIQTGQRRLLNYLIDPFAEHLGAAWSEPS